MFSLILDNIFCGSGAICTRWNRTLEHDDGDLWKDLSPIPIPSPKKPPVPRVVRYVSSSSDDDDISTLCDPHPIRDNDTSMSYSTKHQRTTTKSTKSNVNNVFGGNNMHDLNHDDLLLQIEIEPRNDKFHGDKKYRLGRNQNQQQQQQQQVLNQEQHNNASPYYYSPAKMYNPSSTAEARQSPAGTSPSTTGSSCMNSPVATTTTTTSRIFYTTPADDYCDGSSYSSYRKSSRSVVQRRRMQTWQSATTDKTTQQFENKKLTKRTMKASEKRSNQWMVARTSYVVFEIKMAAYQYYLDCHLPASNAYNQSLARNMELTALK